MMKPDVEALRKRYPAGMRVELVRMDDIQAPPIGTKGTVIGVDDIGSIMVSWDNGSSLNVIFGEDEIRPLKICTIAYGHRREWDSANEAIAFFLSCVSCSDGSERERYETIIAKLKQGLSECSDT